MNVLRLFELHVQLQPLAQQTNTPALAIACGVLLLSFAQGAAFAAEPGDKANSAEATQQGLTKSALIDLNGDGQPEKISIETGGETGMFILRIGSQSIRDGTHDSQSEPPAGFEIVDIDPADRFKEIAIQTRASCELCGQRTFIYGFDKEIRKVGKLGTGVEFKGYGIVLDYGWQGFWSSQTKYVLDGQTRRLKAMPQPFYFVGLNATVKKTFPIYGRQRKASGEVVANLKPGSSIIVVAAEYTEEPKWYLIKSESGLVGWVLIESLSYDYVEGLPWAN